MKILFSISETDEVRVSKQIDEKTTADGVTGELHEWLIAQSIDPHANYLGGLVALDKEDAAKQFAKDGKKANQQWALGLKDPKQWIRGIGQSLKVDNKPTYTVLGDWGFNITADGKIMFVETNLGWQTLGEAIVTKYNSYPVGTAPIEQYIVSQHFTVVNLADALTTSGGYKTAAHISWAASITALQLSRLLISSIREDNHHIAEKLVVLHPDDSLHITEYGYDTNMADSSEVEQESTILPGETITVHNAKEGTDIEKLEGGDVTITPGLKTTAVPKSFPTNNKLNVDNGMSRFRVKNNDLLLKAKIKTVVLRKKTVRGK